MLAACYRRPTDLPEIDRWIRSLRERGLVDDEVHFRMVERDGVPVGVLHDSAGEHELPPSCFLLYGRDGLQVLDDRSFFREYHEPNHSPSS